MLTTFERLAKVVKKETAPANWIEKAFADLVSAIGAVLPSISNSDRGKFLGVNASNNNLGWKAIRQVPEVENADKGKYLHANGDTGALEWSEAGGLPAVTGADEGKVLTVNSSGEWDAETPSGGGGMLVTLSGDNEQADKTFGEIAAALQSGIRPITQVYGCYVPFYVSAYDSESSGWICGIDITVLADETPVKISINTNATQNDYPIFASVT